MKKQLIILTGGGTAGHVVPHIPIIKNLLNQGHTVSYVGSKNGIERNIIKKQNITYYPISTGKLRRYFDFNNFIDIFRILYGFFQSLRIFLKTKPALVFSKGGFVSCPVVWAAWFYNIPVIIHESDISPGLANRLCLPFCQKICYSFTETKKYLPAKKSYHTGLPIRKSLKQGSEQTGKTLCGFNDRKPIILVIGGSSGSLRINSFTRYLLPDLLATYQVCHICGKNNICNTLENKNGYKQFEFVEDDLKHLLAMSEIIISRSGATSIFEFLALKKLNLLIPLSVKASRGDQILNARSFTKSGFSVFIEEEKLSKENLFTALNELSANKKRYYQAMESKNISNAEIKIINIIKQFLENY